jgi:hypothetical protein
MRRWLVIALVQPLGCSLLVDASGLTDEFGEIAVDDSAVDSASTDTNAIDIGEVIEVDPPDSGRDCEQRVRDGVAYVLCKEDRTFEEAEIICSSEFGARLVVIHDEGKQAFLHSWLFARRHAWIGLDDRRQEGDHRWSDGSTPTYLNWRTGPSSEDYNDCVWMQTGGTWEEKMCNNASIPGWYFCEAR